jgi:hypothetical protein
MESSDRINEKARARTTAKSAALRLLWMGLAVLLSRLVGMGLVVVGVCIAVPTRGTSDSAPPIYVLSDVGICGSCDGKGVSGGGGGEGLITPRSTTRSVRSY